MDNKVTKKRVFDILQIGNREDFASRAFDIIIAISIVLNITSLVMSTFDEFEPYYDILSGIEAITICIFCVEYALRIWTAEYLYPDLDRRKAVLRFFVSFDGIIDLLTILPFFFLYGFAAFRMLRVVRIFHLFRLNATYDSFNVITKVLNEKIRFSRQCSSYWSSFSRPPCVCTEWNTQLSPTYSGMLFRVSGGVWRPFSRLATVTSIPLRFSDGSWPLS